jgi:glutathione S-transferase
MDNNKIQPITVWSLGYSPNPWKVILILEELGLPFEKKYVDMTTVKHEPHVSLNPNGRVPTIEDPNTGIILWEVSNTEMSLPAGSCQTKLT